MQLTTITGGATRNRPSATTAHPQRLLVNDARSVMNIIRMDVYKHHPSAIAKAIGVSTGTIYAIRSGRTKWPRHETIFALAKYLGYRFVLERTR